MFRLSTCFSIVLVALLAVAPSVFADTAYPTKPIRFIVTFPPGGSTTTVARMIGEKLTRDWGQPVIVDNRPGGNSVIGTEALARSPADGHTIVLVVSTHVINPLLIPNLPYDTIKDFAPIGTVYSTEYVLAVHPSVQANSVQELIALAKARPGSINYASGDNGGVTHLVSELFNMMAGVKIQNVPYKGSAPALTDTLGGHVQVIFVPPIVALPHIQSGKLKALAVSGDHRLAALPNVPTFTEAGLPGYDVTTWYGILAPAGTPKDIVAKLSTEIASIMAMPDVVEKLHAQGLEPFPSTSDEFAALMKRDMAKYERVIKTAGIKFEN
jgi:tripartite-type tricarboxylate transporter receptor subunit TctC